MAWEAKHRILRDICSYLWEEPADCRRLVLEAQVDISQISFEEPPALRWGSVIMQLMKQQTLHKLTPVLLRDYPENRELQKAVEPWRYGSHGETAPKVEEGLKTEVSPATLVALMTKIEEMAVVLESARIDITRQATQLSEFARWRKALGIMTSVPSPPDTRDEQKEDAP